MTKPTDLLIPATRRFPRHLKISWTPERAIVVLSSPDGQTMLNCASIEHAQVHLDIRVGDQVLWVGNSSYELSTLEADRVRDVFAPLGLTVTVPPPAALPSCSAAHEAKATADLPRRGGDGVTPPAAMSAGGSLDEEYCHAPV